MKGSELKKMITGAGWYLVRNGSKHDLYGHRNCPGVLIPIPRHESKEVPTGTAENILKITGTK
jgi:predicted RNA binding protein YcfA (HicA-like mRNA interferase family)